jgi:hypothetical protein
MAMALSPEQMVSFHRLLKAKGGSISKPKLAMAATNLVVIQVGGDDYAKDTAGVVRRLSGKAFPSASAAAAYKVKASATKKVSGEKSPKCGYHLFMAALANARKSGIALPTGDTPWIELSADEQKIYNDKLAKVSNTSGASGSEGAATPASGSKSGSEGGAEGGAEGVDEGASK